MLLVGIVCSRLSADLNMNSYSSGWIECVMRLSWLWCSLCYFVSDIVVVLEVSCDSGEFESVLGCLVESVC